MQVKSFLETKRSSVVKHSVAKTGLLFIAGQRCGVALWRKLELTRANDIPLRLATSTSRPLQLSIPHLQPPLDYCFVQRRHFFDSYSASIWQFKGLSRPSLGIRHYCKRTSFDQAEVGLTIAYSYWILFPISIVMV